MPMPMQLFEAAEKQAKWKEKQVGFYIEMKQTMRRSNGLM
jgi:hypothetical protein